MDERATGRFLGFTGRPTFDASFTPAIEIGWRLSRAAWGSGFATEAARAVAAFAFQELALDELVSYTAEPNARSRASFAALACATTLPRTSITPTSPTAICAATFSTD